MISHFYPFPGFAHTSVPTKLDKDIPAKTTSSDGDKAANAPITNTPVDHSYVMVDVNGKIVEVGDGAKNKDCYFSGDAGVTARAIEDITAGDTLHWVGSVAKYQLDTSDRINLHYDI